MNIQVLKKVTLFALLLVLGSGCAKFNPHPSPHAAFLKRIQTQQDGNLTVSVAALGPKESKEYFGVPLAKKGIQPVYLKIENAEKSPYLLMPISIDPEYYSPNETAYRNHGGHSSGEQAKMNNFFNDQQIQFTLPPGGSYEGFIYTNSDLGAKEVSVELLGDKKLMRFSFVVPVPGLKADFSQVDFDNLYKPDEIRDVDLETLRHILEGYPCCTTNKKEQGPRGDPVNLVLIGDDEDLITAFVRRGWRQTAIQDKGSSWKSFISLLFHTRYDNAPMSKLFLLGRHQDIAFQKPRRSIHQRNHLRLWMTPLRYAGKAVWIGTVSRDIGIRFTTKSAFFLTHKIDSDIDEARDYLLQDLLLSDAVGNFGYVKGVGEVPTDNPRKNFMGDTYFTDGLRSVVVLTDFPTPLLEAKPLNWETPRVERSGVSSAESAPNPR